ncbi:acyl carrier protein [Bacteroides heparinolyticus]|uniref:acyl carrier protein n=1 Tax=Prevotella heparinolytica TaxID=28113 RepID=UPI003F9FED7A
MTNLEKLNTIFAEVFSVEVSALNADFDKNSVDSWDSVHQLSLTSAVEDEFDIMLDAEDILGFTSYVNAKEILIRNGIEL